MKITIRIAGSLLAAAGLITASATMATAATPHTANVECTGSENFPALDGFTVTLPTHTAAATASW